MRREIEGDQENSPEWIPIHDEVSLRRYCLALLAEHEAAGRVAECHRGETMVGCPECELKAKHADSARVMGVNP